MRALKISAGDQGEGPSSKGPHNTANKCVEEDDQGGLEQRVSEHLHAALSIIDSSIASVMPMGRRSVGVRILISIEDLLKSLLLGESCEFFIVDLTTRGM